MKKGFFFLLSLFLRVSSSCVDQSEDPQSMTGIDNSASLQTVYLEFMTSSRSTQVMSTEVEVFDDSASYSHIELKSVLLRDQSSEIQVMDNSKDFYGVAQGIETVFRSVRLFGSFLQPYLLPCVPRLVTEAAESVKLVFSDFVDTSQALISDCTSDFSVCVQSVLKPGRKFIESVKGLYDCASDPEACFQDIQMFTGSGLIQSVDNKISAISDCIDSPNMCLRTIFQSGIYIARQGPMLPLLFIDIILNISAYDLLSFMTGLLGHMSLINICKNIAKVYITGLLSPSISQYIIYPMITVTCASMFERLTPIVQTSMLPAEITNNTFVEGVKDYMRRYAQYYDKVNEECRQFKHPFGMKSDGIGDILEIYCQVWNALQRLYSGQSHSGADTGLVFRHVWSILLLKP